jgi:hypothetical protein
VVSTGPGTTGEVPWSVLPLIVTHLHVHVHDFPNSIWLTCRRGVANSPWQDHECGNRPIRRRFVVASAAASLREGLAEMFTVNRLLTRTTTALFELDQCHLLVLFGQPQQDAAGDALAERCDGAALGGSESGGDGEAL